MVLILNQKEKWEGLGKQTRVTTAQLNKGYAKLAIGVIFKQQKVPVSNYTLGWKARKWASGMTRQRTQNAKG